MKGGRIVEHGTYKELLDRGVDFHSELGDGGQQTPQLSPAPSLTPANSMPGARTLPLHPHVALFRFLSRNLMVAAGFCKMAVLLCHGDSEDYTRSTSPLPSNGCDG